MFKWKFCAEKKAIEFWKDSILIAPPVWISVSWIVVISNKSVDHNHKCLLLFFFLVSFLFQKLLHFVDIFSSLSNWIFHSFAFIKIHACYNSSMAQLLIFKEEEIKLEQTNKQTIWQIVTICGYFVCVWKCVDFVGLWNWK